MDYETNAIREALPDRFKILKEIGRGGMATVYLAEEQHPRRTVAIKVLNPEFGARLGRKRFVREVEMLSNLNHPHIVPIFAAGEAQGLLYYVMPYQEGETLRERIHREGQPRSISPCRLPAIRRARCNTRTTRTSCTATSSPKTFFSRRDTHSLPISGSPAPLQRPAEIGSPKPASRSARHRI